MIFASCPVWGMAIIAVTLMSQSTLAQPGATCSTSASAGQVTATGCLAVSTCGPSGGANNYISYTFSSYSPNTDGRWHVSFKTNQCPSNANAGTATDGTINSAGGSPACCVQVSLPVAAYSGAGAKAVPLRGTAGYTLFGTNLYGSFEAGFSLGFACSNGAGDCVSGLDVDMCGKELIKECGAAAVTYRMLPDVCGGHATPYHIHGSMRCEYNMQATGHSPLIGFGLDGVGIYGAYESTRTIPVDLDACGGHIGTTPLTTTNGVTFAGTASVYHYHVIDGGPQMLACYGPVASATAARALYSTCNTGYLNVCTEQGLILYDLDCPVFNQQTGGATYNMALTGTVACPDLNTTSNSPTKAPSTAPTISPTLVPTIAPTNSTGDAASSRILNLGLISIISMLVALLFM